MVLSKELKLLSGTFYMEIHVYNTLAKELYIEKKQPQTIQIGAGQWMPSLENYM